MLYLIVRCCPHWLWSSGKVIQEQYFSLTGRGICARILLHVYVVAFWAQGRA